MVRFRVKTSPPKGRNTWKPDTAAIVQSNLFDTVAMLAAESAEAEQKLMDAIAAAKANKLKIAVA